MAKRIHHMGMVMGKGEHDEFHKNAPDLSPRQHEALMKRMGIKQAAGRRMAPYAPDARRTARSGPDARRAVGDRRWFCEVVREEGVARPTRQRALRLQRRNTRTRRTL